MDDERKTKSKLIQRSTVADLYSDIPSEWRDDITELQIKNVGASMDSFLEERMPSKDIDQLNSIEKSLMTMDGNRQPVRAAAKKKEQRKGVSAKQRKEFKVFKIETNPGKYRAYLPLHQLWLEYFRKVMHLEALDLTPGKDLRQLYTKLSKADYHGCIMTVTRSKCPSMVGKTGILLQEGKNSMKLITKEDKLKIIPKANSVFTFEVDGIAFTINGNHFCVKTSQRAVRKFKAKATVDL